MIKTPSRLLNENSNFLGLSALDLVVIGYLFIVLHSLISVFSLAVVFVITLGLIKIRYTQRKKTIRDFITYHLNKKIQAKALSLSTKRNGAFK